MTADEWQQLEAIVDSALKREPADRATFIEEACPNERLRHEVTARLAQESTRIADQGHTRVLTAGTKLGPYQIEKRIGAGGMGEVFRALDTRLRRPVAIKTSRTQFSEHFEREARVIASLNHPNICTLFDVGPDYLVMELCDGETLAARIAKGSLPIAECLKIGSQIAAALAAAHASGVIHRDLKPGNIILTRTGVKVLDFGLAKSVTDETIHADGVVMGTPAYMSPEQRQARPTDARSDIYSFGLILAEMASGARPPYGESRSWAGIPEPIAGIVRGCLETDPQERWQAARDLQRMLESTGASASPADGAKTGAGPAARWAAAVMIVVGAAVIAWIAFRPAAVSIPPVSYRLDIPAPPGTVFRHTSGMAISPDGRQVAFVAASQSGPRIWVRRLDAAEAQEVPGTENGHLPFWSPDGKSLGFFGPGKLQRIELVHGTPRPICDVVTGGGGGTWIKPGIILFNGVNDGPLVKVSADGGSPTPLTTIDKSQGENAHRYPQLLPDGRHFLYFVRGTDYLPGVNWSSGEYVGSLDDPRLKIKVLSSRLEAIFLAGAKGDPDALLYMREDGTLVAQAFDAKRFQLTGEPRVLAKGLPVHPAGSRMIDAAAASGTILYGTEGTDQFQLTWLTREGTRVETVGETGRYTGLRISPDGRRVAVLQGGGVWQIELARGVMSKMADGDFGPVWSPDGSRIVYTVGAPPNLAIRDTQALTPARRLYEAEQSHLPLDWSSDGRWLLFTSTPNDPKSRTRADLWTLAMESGEAATAFTSTPFRETNGQFSADGKWIAYTTDESGRDEVVVQSFPHTGRKWQASSKGGNYVRWRNDGKELFYLAPDGKLMAVAVREAEKELEFGTPQPLFELPNHSQRALGFPYDVSADGRRFLVLAPVGSETPTLSVITNWGVGR